MEIERMKR